jgi:hypothetical protein
MTETGFAVASTKPTTGRRIRTSAPLRFTSHESRITSHESSLTNHHSLPINHGLLPDTACRVEMSVSHSKQTIAQRSTRHWNEGVAATDFFNPRSRFSFGAIKMVRRFRHESQ